MSEFKHLCVLLGGIILFAACSGQEHHSEDSADNTMADASSPYLQQHADNPVHWKEWGPESLALAKEEDKPLIISIGYAACHWCHVMEHESFMDTAVARYMNEHFISIKVDREERPDVDQIYMDAARLISGRGGWPLNAFALPDGKPFYAGTYFPKDKWMKLMKTMNDYYTNKKDEVLKQAESLAKGIQEDPLLQMKADSTGFFNERKYHEIFEGYKGQIDFKYGGFRGTPKFPLPSGWEFLLQYHYTTGNARALEAVTTTLDHMARGALYDQVGGGFSRYSTDTKWKIPHFEKMLYDNAQLVSLYAHAYQLTRNPQYAEIIRETLSFIDREMTDKNGGFYSSLNADSEGEEGKYYVWTKKEIDQALDEETAVLIKDYYQITEEGNWEEGKNVLHRSEGDSRFIEQHGLNQKSWDSLLRSVHSQLFDLRKERIRPSMDEKVLTAWNAMMTEGYLDAYRALGDEEYLNRAVQAAKFLDKTMVEKNGKVWRSWRDKRSDIPGYLIDYGTLASAFIALYELTFDKYWLDRAEAITTYAVDHFSDEDSPVFYYTSDQSEELIARKKEIRDNVIPSSNSIMAHVLYRLGHYYYRQDYIKKARSMVESIAGEIPEGEAYFSNWARLAGMIIEEPFEIAIVGNTATEKSLKMQQQYLPTSFFLGGTKENLALLENKKVEDITRIYVCKKRVCKKPVERVDAALRQIENW